MYQSNFFTHIPQVLSTGLSFARSAHNLFSVVITLQNSFRMRLCELKEKKPAPRRRRKSVDVSRHMEFSSHVDTV